MCNGFPTVKNCANMTVDICHLLIKTQWSTTTARYQSHILSEINPSITEQQAIIASTGDARSDGMMHTVCYRTR